MGGLRSRIFSLEGVLHEEVDVHGQPVPGGAEAGRGREHGISTATFYKWRSKFGGMDASLMGRMKELEEENRRLKKLYIEAQIKADIISEALAKKL